MKDFEKSWNVLKVRIAANRHNGNTIPDPANIATKAAINCSFLYGEKLLPACPNSSSHKEEKQEDELDVLAREFQERADLEHKFGGAVLQSSNLVDDDDLSDIGSVTSNGSVLELGFDMATEDTGIYTEARCASPASCTAFV